MDCWIRSFVALVVGSGLLLIGMSGCNLGEPGTSTAPPVASAPSPSLLLAKPTQAEKTEVRKTEGERTTPTQRVDTKQLTDVVKAEVKGGEATGCACGSPDDRHR